jgi:hypothetical protein
MQQIYFVAEPKKAVGGKTVDRKTACVGNVLQRIGLQVC